MRGILYTVGFIALAVPMAANASTAYGSLNNFDAVNDCGQICYGFEIEIEDAHSTDVTYTYDYNHYGAPIISEDNSDPLHPRAIIRYESGKNPDGSWTAFTSIPAGPILPTDGHQFTNPDVNFGGEHFGVGFYGNSVVRYHWLVDDGFGNLVQGCVVDIATPSFIYIPPVDLVPAQVQAIIAAPIPEVHPMEFGPAQWVKVTTTESHNDSILELNDLLSDDPDDPADHNWLHGENPEIEIEWQLMQTEFNHPDGGVNGKQNGLPEELPSGDEVITRRYDFFEYVGPFDTESGEAKADNVGPDGVHGEGIAIIDGVEVDLSLLEVVGGYIGAQMAGFDPEGNIGLIDNLQDGYVFEPYVDRTVVVSGTAPIVTEVTGALPEGMILDVASGVLSGTPLVSGVFSFTVHSTDANAGDVTKLYDLRILGAGEGEGEGEGECAVDTNLPVISLIGGDVAIECGVSYVDAGANASDTCDGDLSGSIVAVSTVPDPAVMGDYTVTYDVSDAAANAAIQVVRNVAVVDTSAPVITLVGGNLTVDCQGAFTEPGFSASDTCAGDLSAGVVVTGAVDSTVPGDYTLTYDVSDADGNPEQLTRVVTVLSNCPVGASCFPDGTCFELPEAVCIAAGGTYQGDGTTCALAACPQPAPGTYEDHSGDQNADHVISLIELLRGIQFFNLGEFHCDIAGEDGYSPGVGDQSCTPHSSDYSPQNWNLELAELLRFIQFFNMGGFVDCPSAGTEDGFCPIPVF